MQSRLKQAALFSVKLLLSIAVLVSIARSLDQGRLRTQSVSAHPLLLAFALALISFQAIVLNGRRALIVRALGVSLDRLADPRDQSLVEPSVESNRDSCRWRADACGRRRYRGPVYARSSVSQAA